MINCSTNPLLHNTAAACKTLPMPTAGVADLNTAEAQVATFNENPPTLEPADDESEEYYEQPPPGPSLGERHVVGSKTPITLTADERGECAKCLRSSTLFQFCSDESIIKVVGNMRREIFSEGEV